MIEIQQELFFDTPKGQGLALFVIDRGSNSDLEWIFVITETGEIWSFKNYEIKMAKNRTLNIRQNEC